MFLSYVEFVLESVSRSCIRKSYSLMSSSDELKNTLMDCVNGMYPKIQVNSVRNVKSYIGVAVNDGYPRSIVIKTDEPTIALLCTLIYNTGIERAVDMIEYIKTGGIVVEYSVYPGDKVPSRKEMLAMRNLSTNEFGEYVPMYISTPVMKKF